MSQKDSQAEGLLHSILRPSLGCQGLAQATPEYAQTQDALKMDGLESKGTNQKLYLQF